ncbi:MAG: hypothetical protein AB7H96_06385 [Vicinamibacterales bacterium]
MAALLVGMSVAAVLMTAVLPVWRRMVQRDREAELVFRGEQYVRAISLFQKKSGPGVLPPDVDTLVRGRFLRKKFKDPITNQDFDLLSPSQSAGTTGAALAPGGGLSAQPPRPGAPNPTPAQGGTAGFVIGAQPSGRGGAGGVIGVASKSKDTSIRIYNGRSKYNEWQFIFVQQQAPGAGAPGQRGAGPGGGPGGRGAQPQPGGVGGGARGRGNVPPGPAGGGRQGQPVQSPPSPFGPRPVR